MTLLNQADDIRLGASGVSAVYAGSTQVWPPAAAASYADTVIADHPIAFLPLDDASAGHSARDLIGGHPGTYVGAIVSGPGIGDGSPAAILDGASSIPIPSLTNIAVPTVSFELWAKPDPGVSYYGLISKTVGNYPSPWDWYAYSDLTMVFATATFPTGGALSFAEWRHVVVTWDATSRLLMYVNTSVMLDAAASTLPNGSTPVVIGNRDDGVTAFKGSLAKVALYDYVLSLGQVTAHYAAGSS